MFEKEDKETYTLKSDVSIGFRRKISGNYCGANTLPATAKFNLKVKDGRIYAYKVSEIALWNEKRIDIFSINPMIFS